MKIYTKTGDDGTTGLLGNTRLRKNALRIEAYGAVDELNAHLGLMLARLPREAESTQPWLDAIQADLFVIGTILATPPKTTKAHATLSSARVEALEQQIDQMERNLPALTNFIFPRGTASASLTHVARSVCRRAERRVVALDSEEKLEPVVLTYLNRLSDFLFVLARWTNRQEGGSETPWVSPAGFEPGGIKPDKLNASLNKLEEDKKRRQSLFEKTASDLEKKKRDADKLFRQNVDEIQKQGGKVEKPIRPMDLD